MTVEPMELLDNLAIAAQAEERLARADAGRDTPLEEAARELGFDTKEIFAETSEVDPPRSAA